MKTSTKSVVVAIILLVSNMMLPQKVSCLEAMPEIPTRGKKLEDFVPPGWRIFKQASGDLNSDKRDDYALILAKDGDAPESGYSEGAREFWPRPLLVLHAGEDGMLERASCSWGAVMSGKVANEFALLVVDVNIAGGNVVVNIGNGATSIAAFESKYRLQDDRYELIGFTESGGNSRIGSYYSIDSNLITGLSIEEKTQQYITGDKPEKKESFSHYFLRAGLVSKSPSVAGVFIAQDWPGPSVSLKRSANIVIGKKLWRNASDLSAQLYGVHTDTDLFIAARVTHKSPGKGAFLRLAGPKQKISPAQSLTTVNPNGEFIVARFPLSTLSKVTSGGFGRVSADYKSVLASAQIVEPGKDGMPEMILSTSCDAERHSGSIELTKTPSLPTLENWDWAHRDQ